MTMPHHVTIVSDVAAAGCADVADVAAACDGKFAVVVADYAFAVTAVTAVDDGDDYGCD